MKNYIELLDKIQAALNKLRRLNDAEQITTSDALEFEQLVTAMCRQMRWQNFTIASRDPYSNAKRVTQTASVAEAESRIPLNDPSVPEVARVIAQIVSKRRKLLTISGAQIAELKRPVQLLDGSIHPSPQELLETHGQIFIDHLYRAALFPFTKAKDDKVGFSSIIRAVRGYDWKRSGWLDYKRLRDEQNTSIVASQEEWDNGF